MYSSLDHLRAFYRCETISEMFRNETIVERLRNVRMFLRGKQITFYREREVLKYYWLGRNGDWTIKEADEGFLHSITILRYDYCQIVGIPYQGPELHFEETPIDEPTRFDKQKTAEKVMGAMAMGTLITLAGLHAYRLWSGRS